MKRCLRKWFLRVALRFSRRAAGLAATRRRRSRVCFAGNCSRSGFLFARTLSDQSARAVRKSQSIRHPAFAQNCSLLPGSSPTQFLSHMQDLAPPSAAAFLFFPSSEMCPPRMRKAEVFQFSGQPPAPLLRLAFPTSMPHESGARHRRLWSKPLRRAVLVGGSPQSLAVLLRA